jgi:hypothetical protein
MDIALVTSSAYPDLEPFDRPLRSALGDLGLDARAVVWNDPAVDWSTIGVAVVRSAWDCHLVPDQFLAWVDRAGQQTRLHNPPATLRWNMQKRYLRTLAERGVAVTPTLWVERGERCDVSAHARAAGWEAIVIKPEVSAGALETHVFAADQWDEAQRVADRLGADHALMVQPYLRSFERDGERSYIFFDGKLSHAVRRPPTLLTAPRGFVAPSLFVPDDPLELRLAESVSDAVGRELLYARVDIATDNDGQPRLQEVELTEPCLFLSLTPTATETLARAIRARLPQR